MIRLASFFPDRLNLDGDQGNLLALRLYLQAAGFEATIESVGAANSYDSVHFALLGHGSKAAMSSIGVQLSAVDFSQLITKLPGLAIGSGFEYLAALGNTKSQVNRGERESEFSIGKLGTISALGYRNTDSGLPNLELNGNWICSMLHGPVLAKNPVLLHRAAKAAVSAAGLMWPVLPPSELSSWVDDLNRINQKIWSLETEEPYPALVL